MPIELFETIITPLYFNFHCKPVRGSIFCLSFMYCNN